MYARGVNAEAQVQTLRLWMRPIVAEDLQRLLELDADPKVMRYINGGRPNTPQDYETLLPRMCAFADKPYGYFAAYYQPSDDTPMGGPSSKLTELHPGFIGWFHLRPSVFDPSMLELGFRLQQRAWRRGLATEGSRELLRLAFEQLDQAAVDACAMESNEASIAVMERCGMTRDRVYKHPSVGIEVMRYVITKAQYLESCG